MAMQCLLAYQR